MANKILGTSVNAEYMKKLVKEGGNVWFTIWQNGKPVKGAYVLGLQFKPKNEKGYYTINLIAPGCSSSRKSDNTNVDEEFI